MGNQGQWGVKPKILDRPQRFLNPDLTYLRVKEGKTDTLFKAQTQKLTSY